MVGSGLEANKDNPEVEVDPRREDPVILQQISQLRAMTVVIINTTIGSSNVAWVNLQSE